MEIDRGDQNFTQTHTHTHTQTHTHNRYTDTHTPAAHYISLFFFFKKETRQKMSGWNLCFLVINWLMNNIDNSYPVSLPVTRKGVFMLTQGKERNGWAVTKSNSPYKDLRASTKTILCIWWNSEGVLYYELLPRGVNITADIYCQQLRRLADAIQETPPTILREMMLLHDNARPHSANLTKTLYWS